MMRKVDKLAEDLATVFGDALTIVVSRIGEVTVEVDHAHLIKVATTLRDTPQFGFDQLIDVAGVDYLGYGQTEWETDQATRTGFSRGVARKGMQLGEGHPRFAVVYHLLSLDSNVRLRMRVFCPDDEVPMVASVNAIWPSANWFEREAFDLFGILFDGHPDLRRILTDYGFIGHPFRKDFPLIGNVEVRYDPERQRVAYQPVSIEPRVLVPKVIRHDHRYEDGN